MKKTLVLLVTLACCLEPVAVFAAKPAAGRPAPKAAAAKTPANKKPVAKPAAPAAAAPQKVNTIAKNPYIGAIVMDATTGETLFEDRADIPGYPASTLKLMTLLVIQNKIEKGEIKLTDTVPVSVNAYKTGGSQVYLDPKESFPVEELLYALMIQSANDAAVALAEFVSGSTGAFVELMNQTAQELGMENTRFASPHGLPPGPGQKNDVTTARDMVLLCRELCRHADIFKYTSQSYRQFRAGTPKPFDMRTHNPFLKEKMPGCDGFKTGYTASAGWSIAVSRRCGERHLVVYVLGSTERKLRDEKARELLMKYSK
ncbi:MAG: D-alanyl-D-alanine carboxypeptidase [Kiritimatiellae bacterium]|nr:D-alanyl-D-alanine carboxypeptidase [Kiritimatiellia bacterium]